MFNTFNIYMLFRMHLNKQGANRRRPRRGRPIYHNPNSDMPRGGRCYLDSVQIRAWGTLTHYLESI